MKVSPNQKGFSMMEVVMAMGLMGITALGVMQIQKSTTTTQIRAENSLEMYQIRQRIQQNFLDQNICKETLEGFNMLNDTSIDGDVSPSSPVALPAIYYQAKDIDGNDVGARRELFEVGQEFNGGRIKLATFEIYKVVNVGIALPPPSIRSIKHEITLRAGFLRKTSRSQADSDGKMIYTFVRISAMVGTGNGGTVPSPAIAVGTVEKCFSAEGNAVISAMRAACLAIDLDGVGGPDNEFDDVTLKCNPKANEGYCIYGGSYSNSVLGSNADYENPVTGTRSCSTGFTPVKTGHFTRPVSRACGKATCYEFYQQTQITCVKCFGVNGPGTEPVIVGIIPGMAGCDSGDCVGTPSGLTDYIINDSCVNEIVCGAGTYGFDSTNDGCDDQCTPIGGFGGISP